MKKRLLALVVAIALLLCGCCTCDTQVEQLQQRVTELENRLAAITVTEPAPTEPAPTEPAPTEPALTEPAPTEPASDESSDMSRFLDNLLESNNHADWLSVATCKEATLDHLLRCAQKCASITSSYTTAHNIADALVSNPKATGKVVEALANSVYPGVWLRIASADCNDVNSLILVAQKCASITSSYTTAYNIADALVSNPKFTAQVAMELSNSEHTSVKNLAHQALESLENNN